MASLATCVCNIKPKYRCGYTSVLVLIPNLMINRSINNTHKRVINTEKKKSAHLTQVSTSSEMVQNNLVACVSWTVPDTVESMGLSEGLNS